MFGFGKKKPLSTEDFVDAANDVERRISEGDYVGAAQAAAALRKAIEANNGPNTPIWGEAQFLEARTALVLGDYAKAVEHMEAACEIVGDDEETVKMRLTNEMNYGDILSELGDFDAAEAVHRRALEERRAFYGDEHPGFGYGAESLGTLLMRKGEYDEAADLAQEAVLAFRNGEPHKLDATLILWMLAEKSRKPNGLALNLLQEVDRRRVINAIANAPGYLFIDATIDLRWEVFEALDDEATDLKMSTLATIANYAQALDRMDDRIRALEHYVELAGNLSTDDEAFALQGLALAYEEAGRVDDATARYEQALEAADGQAAQVRRNFALFLAEHDEPDRAEALFHEALDRADGEVWARTTGAYGIFLHHAERYDEAVLRLQACIDGLPPSHPDRLSADAHLQFARNAESCNCDVGMPVALSGFVHDVINEYVPDDLLDDVVVSADFEISVTLAREPTDEEVEAIQLATAEARRRISEMQHV